MIKIFSVFLVSCSLSVVLFAQQQREMEERVLEVVNVTPTRELLLIMTGPVDHPRDRDEIYTCPDATRGSYYTGYLTVTLVDRQTRRAINELRLDTNTGEGEANTFDIPYLIRPGYYRVPKLDKYKEGKPIIMDLKDYNNDGLPHEFALFNALACMGLDTTLIGYSKKQDKVIQYPIELKTSRGLSKGFWADYLFGNKPDKKGVWRYQIDYRGRSGALEKYEFRYDEKREIFYGKLTSIFE